MSLVNLTLLYEWPNKDGGKIHNRNGVKSYSGTFYFVNFDNIKSKTIR